MDSTTMETLFPRVLPDTIFPKILADLHRPEGIEYRTEYNQRIWNLAEKHRDRQDITQHEINYINTLEFMPQNNIMVPHEKFLYGIDSLFDVIGVSFEYTSETGVVKNVALMEYYTQNSPVKKGTGKTGLALKISGIGINYDEIPCPRCRDEPYETDKAISELDKKSLTCLPYEKGNVRLITTDLMFIGKGDDEKLNIAPAVAEPFIAQMDAARHISRAHNSYYKEDTGRKIPWLKEYCEKLAEKYFVKFGNDGLFIDPFSHVELDEVYIVRRLSNFKNGKLRTRKIPEKQAKRILEAVLLRNPVSHPIYPKNTFWLMHEGEHKKRVLNAMNNLIEIPNVHMLDIPANDPTTHLHDATEIMKESLEKEN